MTLTLRPTRQEKAELQPIAALLAAEFLTAELAATQAILERRKDAVRQFYPKAEDLPEGEAEVMEAYRERMALIEELRIQAEHTPLPDVFDRRLRTARERLSDLARNGMFSQAQRAEHWRLYRQHQTLEELLAHWLGWLLAERPQPEAAA